MGANIHLMDVPEAEETEWLTRLGFSERMKYTDLQTGSLEAAWQNK